MDAIPVIDLRLLTQAEINSLALSSSTSASSFLPDRSSGDDVVVPKIDRSVFNESAGSRKQTYSRLRLAPPKSTSSSSSSPATTTTTTGRRRGRPRSVSAPSLTTVPYSVPDTSASDAAIDDRGRKENEQIVQFLRQLFAKNGHTEALAVSNIVPDSKPSFVSDSNPQTKPQSLICGNDGEQRKRVRKKRRVVEEFGVGNNVADESADKEIFNVNDVAVDVVRLGEKEDKLFKDEFAKRSVGLVTEAEFLGFLNGLEGQWGSRRKRRKVVNAGSFGDWLPKGWKLLLGLKRKDGAVWVYCRRYISPSGKQFVSCKEISRYLLSLIGHREATPSVPVTKDEITLGTGKHTAGSDAGIIHQDINRKDMGSFFSGALFSVCAEPEKTNTISNVKKSPKDRMLNPLECHDCNLKFPDKASHVQHLLIFHEGNADRYRIGKSISSGVIIKDGKYECQYCHKMFTERHRYNGHVGSHVRNYSRRLDLLMDEAIVEEGSEEISSLMKSRHDNSEANAKEPDEKENLSKDSNSFDPTYEVTDKGSLCITINHYSNGGLDCISSNSLTDCSLEIRNSEADVKLSNSNYTNSDSVIDIKRDTCLEVNSYAKKIAPQVSCEQLKNIIPGSILDNSSREIISDQLNICRVTDEKPKDQDESINPYPMLKVSTHLSRNNDKESSAHEMMSEGTSFNVFVLDNNVSGEDFGSTNKTSNSINNNDSNVASQTVCNSECRNSEANNINYTTMIYDEQNNRYKVSDENRSGTTGSASAFGASCDIDRPGTTQKKSNIPGDNQIGSYDKMGKTMFSISEVNNNQIHSQLDLNNMMTEKFRNSAEENVEKNNKPIASLDATDSLCYVENLTSETTTGQCVPTCSIINDTENRIAEHKVEVESSFVNLSDHCEHSAENSSFGYRQIDEIGSSLNEQQFYLGSHLNSLPGSVPSYSIQASANSVLGSNLENAVFTSVNGQACDLECRMDDVQLSSIEDSLACQASDLCKELENDIGVGSFGVKNDSARNNVEEGSELDQQSVHTPSLWLQPSNPLTTNNMISNQGTNRSYETQQKKTHPSSGLEEQLKLANIGITDTVLLANQSSGLRPEDTMGLSYNNGDLGQVFTPVQSGWEMSAADMASRDQNQVSTTICIWCGVEFEQKGINLQLQYDTVGFICPTCKSKISGQLKF